MLNLPVSSRRDEALKYIFCVCDRGSTKIKNKSRHLSAEVKSPCFPYLSSQILLDYFSFRRFSFLARINSNKVPARVAHMGIIRDDLGAILNFKSHIRTNSLSLSHRPTQICSRSHTKPELQSACRYISVDGLSASYKSLW